MNKILVVAFGGNALIDDSGDVSFSHQYQYLTSVINHIVDLKEQGYKILIVHGNGPQVGFSLRRSELAQSEVPILPIDYAVAESQGAIGFMFQKALFSELARRNNATKVISLITQTLVNEADPAFKVPTKPIGGFMSENQALQMQKKFGWSIMEDSGRGWRRVVASPKPIAVLETPIIQDLLAQGTIVIAAGGGGIAVSQDESGTITSLEAVIDKDLTASILASNLNAEYFLIPTGVSQVAINFGQSNQQWLSELTVNEANRLITQNQFGKGSMLPKVEAILSYLEKYPAGQGIITDPASMTKAVKGLAGTKIQG